MAIVALQEQAFESLFDRLPLIRVRHQLPLVSGLFLFLSKCCDLFWIYSPGGERVKII